MCASFKRPKRDRLSAVRALSQTDFLDAAGEIYPGGLAPILTSAAPAVWTPAMFGLVPHWADPAKLARMTYNARSETVAEKASYRNAWRLGQRCAIPVEAFYEPCYESGRAVRWRIERADGALLWIAGIWEQRVRDPGPARWSFSMLTVNADGHSVMGRFHRPGDEKRSVVVLNDRQLDAWLQAPGELALAEFLVPPPADMLSCAAAPVVRTRGPS
jgi:putative SOS response-associated peptidase YedK